MICCEDCFKLMETFCDLYNQLKITELLTEWKVRTLISVMRQAQRVSLRMKCFKEFLGKAEEVEEGTSDGLIRSIIKLRKELIKKGFQKTTTAFPKLSVVKLPPQPLGRNGSLNVNEEDDADEDESLEVLKATTISKQSLEAGNNGYDSSIGIGGAFVPMVDDNGEMGSEHESVSNNLSGSLALEPDPQLKSEEHHQKNNDEMEITAGVVDDEDETGSISCMTSSSEDNFEFDGDQSDPEINPEETKPFEIVVLPTPNPNMEDFEEEIFIQDSDPDSAIFVQETTNIAVATEEVPRKKIKKEMDSKSNNRRSCYPTDFRLKCPDCSGLFEDVKSFLIHRKTSESCGGSYDPIKNVRVQILISGGNEKKNSENGEDEAVKFNSPFAIVDLPQKVFVCEVCDRATYTVEDMEIHKKLHGSFPCSFCDFEVNYAPSLPMHELQHSMRRSGRDPRGKYIVHNCPHCEFSCKMSSLSYIMHHLKQHLSINVRNFSCVICYKQDVTKTKRGLAEHFKTHHDLSKSGNTRDVKECKVTTDCAAYFVTDRQLKTHLHWYHKRKLSYQSPRKIIKHKACDERFASFKQLGNDNESSASFKDENPSDDDDDNNNVSSSDESVEVKVNIHERQTMVTKASQSKSGNASIKIGTVPGTSVGKAKPKLKRTPSNYHQFLLFRLKCPDCEFLARDMKSLLTHRQTSACCCDGYDPNSSIKVEVRVPLKEGISSWSNFRKLFATVEVPQEIFICKECDLALFSAEDLEAHGKLHGSFHCKFCNTEFTYAPNLCSHELRHSMKKNKRNQHDTFATGCCPRCDFKWAVGGHQRSQYVNHYFATHLGLSLNETKCAICKTDRNYQRKNRLAQHLKNFHDLTNIAPEDVKRCDLNGCTAYFLHPTQLGFHLKHHHNISGRQATLMKSYNKCKECGKRFSCPSQLRHHRMNKHVGLDKVFPCPFSKCQQVFETERELEIHIKRSIPFHKSLEDTSRAKNCTECGKLCHGKGGLRIHMKSHEVSHVCEQCGKRFKIKQNLEMHHLSHSGPESWKFSCSICSKKCVSKGKLTEHMRTHSKDKEFVCQVCGQKYAHRHNLRIHVNNKHGDRVQDIPKKYDKTNLTSQKGIKRKKVEEDLQDEDNSSSSDAEDDSNDK